jgi:hypothetical protein
MRQFASVLTLAASLAVSQVEAFWGTGHLLGKFRIDNFSGLNEPF